MDLNYDSFKDTANEILEGAGNVVVQMHGKMEKSYNYLEIHDNNIDVSLVPLQISVYNLSILAMLSTLTHGPLRSQAVHHHVNLKVFKPFLLIQVQPKRTRATKNSTQLSAIKLTAY